MRTFSSYNFNGNEIAVRAPDTHGDFNYLCNTAFAQAMYSDEDSMFAKLLDRQRHYVRHIVAIMQDDEVYGISLIWDYAQRAVDLKRVDSVNQLYEYGFLQHAIGVFVTPNKRGGKVGSLIANYNLKSFEEKVFCIGETPEQQKFWASHAVDKTNLEFMLINKASTKINFGGK